MRYLYILFIYIPLLVFTSCEYSTNEIYYREVNNDVPVPTITLNTNLNSDTIIVYGTPRVNFNIQLDRNKIMATDLFVNDIKHENVESDTQGRYSFPIYSLQEGINKLKTVLYISTQTGSIADKTGNEAFVETKEWVIIFSADKPHCTSEVVDGRLKLTWTPYKNIGSRKYYITHYWDTVLDSTSNNWYIDSTYVGYPRDYIITVADKGVSNYRALHRENYTNDKIYLTQNDSIVIKWNKWKFYNNISGYKIEHIGSMLPMVFKNPDDTTYVLKGVRGQYYIFYITLMPQNTKNNPPLAYQIGSISRTY